MLPPLDHPIICPIIVGRDLPIQALVRLFERVHSNQGQVALISGEAGIGKSRLVRELRAQFPPTALLTQGHCFEADQTLPYAPIADLLRAYIATLPPSHRASLLTAELSRLLPEVAHEFPDLAAMEATGNIEKRRLHQALLNLFGSLSAAQPLVMIIEDVHWCDDASLEFLLLLARRMSNQPFLLLLTFRDEISAGLTDILAQLDRERMTTEFHLPRLSLESVGTMLRAIFGMDRSPRSELVAALHGLSEGNPFFIEEMLKSLVAAGEIFLADGKWERKPLDELHIPRTVQVSLRQRLNQLSLTAQEILSIAAVAGRRFDFALLQELTGLAESELLPIMRELREAQFVAEVDADTFMFRHALTRQAVYQNMLTRARRSLHRQIANVLESRAGQPSANTTLPDLAYHYFQAEQWDKAAHFGWEAGQYADTLYAPRAALEHYGRALTALERLNAVPPLALLRARGKARELTGDFEAARADYERSLRAARAAGDQQGEWQSLYDLGFLHLGLDLALAGRYLNEAIIAARALDNPVPLAESLNRLGNWYINQDLPLDALPYHQEALSIFEQIDDVHGRVATLDLLGVTSVVSGDVVNSVRYYDQAIPLFRQLNDRLGLSSALSVTCNRGCSCMAETVYCPPTDLEFLLVSADEARQIAGEVGWQHGESAADMYVGYGLVLHGEYQEGLFRAQRGLEIALTAGHSLYQAGNQMTLGRLYNDILAFEAARDTLEAALHTAREISGKFMESSVGGFLVSSYIGLGELAQAGQLIAALHSPHMQSVGQRIVRCAEAELALAQGDATQAFALIEHLITTAPSSAGQVIPRLWRMKAEALLLLGDIAASRALLQEAAVSVRVSGLYALLWRILLSQSRVEFAVGQRGRAEDHLDAAHALLHRLSDKLADPPLREQFRRRALSLMPDVPPLSPRQSARIAYDGLTEREREIAALIAAGHSSRVIAEQLVLSKRTVDAHTANILAKLGFTSRIQIVRWAVEKGLL